MFEEMKSYIIIFVIVVKFGPPFPGNFFFFVLNGISSRYLRHLFATGFVKNTFTTANGDET